MKLYHLVDNDLLNALLDNQPVNTGLKNTIDFEDVYSLWKHRPTWLLADLTVAPTHALYVWPQGKANIPVLVVLGLCF